MELNFVSCLGVIGGGKTYTAQTFVDKGYVLINFADELKRMASDILQFEMFGDACKKESWLNSHLQGAFTGRQFLQRLGEGCRSIDDLFWVKAWEKKVWEAFRAGKSVVCADMRYVNEVESSVWWQPQNKIKECVTFTAQYIICDYKSDRYNATDPHSSEKVAQKLLELGYKDGDILDLSKMRDLNSKLKEIL